MTERRRIAVVGSGAAGMMSAWSLNRQAGNDVYLYEKNDYIGGHTNTVTVDYTDNNGLKKQVPIDTGFIVFNTLNYPNLVNFFKEVGVETVASDMSFALSLRGNENVEWSSDNVNTVFAQRSNIVSPSFWSMLLDMVKFNNEAVEVLNNPKFNGVTVGEYIRLRGYSDSFVRYYLLPMTGAVWSTPLTTMFEFPIQTMIHFMQNHCFMQLVGRPVWRTVKNGSIEYVKKILQELKPENVRKNTGVTKIKRADGKVHVYDDKGNEEVFDSVVLACHADQSRQILGEDITVDEETLLKDFKFKKNIAYLHSDPSLMPARRSTWSSWNVLMKADKPGDISDDICLTYWMNRLQPWLQDCDRDFFVTLNPLTPPKPELTYKVIEYEHPVFLQENVSQQQKLDTIQPPVLFCGAWGTFGFHEDAATSGLTVAEKLGAPAPFPLSYARWHVPAVRPNRWPRRIFTAVTVGVLSVFVSRLWRYATGPNSSAAEGPIITLYRLATEQVSRTGLFDAVRGLWRK